MYGGYTHFYQVTRQINDHEMAVFKCNSCGKCCSSFGSLISIERQLGDRDYYCRYSLTKEIFPVHVDAEYTDEVSERVSRKEYVQVSSAKNACPFLCGKPRGDGFSCAVYATRPVVCRQFRCYRMIVYDSRGNLLGKVIGANGISTQDATLAQLWKEQIAAIPHAHPPGSNDPAWIKKVNEILAAHGYRGDAVE
jgi:Fe-S-cluster containining protein